MAPTSATSSATVLPVRDALAEDLLEPAARLVGVRDYQLRRVGQQGGVMDGRAPRDLALVGSGIGEGALELAVDAPRPGRRRPARSIRLASLRHRR